MSAPSARVPMPLPPPQVLWLYALSCALPFAVVGAAFSPVAQCGHACLLAFFLLVAAAGLSFLLLLGGVLLRRILREHGVSSRLVQWGLVSQALLFALAGGFVFILWLLA